MTYQLVTTAVGGRSYPGIQCLVCQRISYNPYDRAQRYCGWCDRFHDDPLPRGTSANSQKGSQKS